MGVESNRVILKKGLLRGNSVELTNARSFMETHDVGMYACMYVGVHVCTLRLIDETKHGSRQAAAKLQVFIHLSSFDV